MRMPTSSFEHLTTLTDEVGTFSHADHAQPSRTRGYGTEEVARLLVATARQQQPSQVVVDLGRTAQRFLAEAQDPDGRVHERRSAVGAWEGEPGTGDAWGRSMRAWGMVVRLGADARTRRLATSCFRRGAAHRGTTTRATVLAALGAVEVLTARPHYDDARALLSDAVTAIGAPREDAGWPWPEDRLTSDNAVLCELLVAAGPLLDRPELVSDGLRLLGWLLDRETHDGHLSPTPAGGAGPGDTRGFDQRPSEVAAMADACATAMAVSGSASWQRGIDLAAGWFAGDNDAGAPMWDPLTDGGYDALSAAGAGHNQGAVATLSMITTSQHLPRRAAVRVGSA